VLLFTVFITDIALLTLLQLYCFYFIVALRAYAACFSLLFLLLTLRY
jgi:hypothetical protein